MTKKELEVKIAAMTKAGDKMAAELEAQWNKRFTSMIKRWNKAKTGA